MTGQSKGESMVNGDGAIIQIHQIDAERLVAKSADYINGLTEEERNIHLVQIICTLNTMAFTSPDRLTGSLLALQLSQLGCRFKFSDVRVLNDDN